MRDYTNCPFYCIISEEQFMEEESMALQDRLHRLPGGELSVEEAQKR